MGTVFVDRCPDCKAMTGDLYFHQEKQCPVRQVRAEERQASRRQYADYFAQRAEDFEDELGRVPKKHRRRIRFLRDANQAASRALRR